jgi:hypothetical protein
VHLHNSIPLEPHRSTKKEVAKVKRNVPYHCLLLLTAVNLVKLFYKFKYKGDIILKKSKKSVKIVSEDVKQPIYTSKSTSSF